MIFLKFRPLLVSATLILGSSLTAQDGTDEAANASESVPLEDLSYTEQLAALGVETTVGPATATLGAFAEIELPDEAIFIGEGSLERYFEITQNMYGGNEVGVVVSPEGWTMFFDFDPIGYVKDDEKDALDAEELMDSMTANQEAANEMRLERGWDAMRMQGWATEPYYDPNTNNLKWAFELSSSADNYQETWINENIRLLGRSGVMNVTLVAGPDGFAAAEASADVLLANGFTYVAGERYSEFKEGDKIAEYGLAALVLGGAGVMAAKSGLLAKFWKFIVFGALAVAGFFKKIWNFLTGRKEPEAEEQA